MWALVREFADEFIATYAEVLGIACRWFPPLRWFIDVRERAVDLCRAAGRELAA